MFENNFKLFGPSFIVIYSSVWFYNLLARY